MFVDKTPLKAVHYRIVNQELSDKLIADRLRLDRLMADRRPPRREGQSPRRPNGPPSSNRPKFASGPRRPRPGTGSFASGDARRPRPGTGSSPSGEARRPRPGTGSFASGDARRPRPGTGSSASGDARRPRPGTGASASGAIRKPAQDRSRTPKSTSSADEDRIQKILAHAGLGSRRACEELILQGRVTVDRVVVRELGTKVDPRKCNIQVDGQTVKVEKPVYYAVNKPKGYVSTNADPSGRPRVIDLMPELPERVYTVGRLDEMSVGLILLTNDGELANKLTHPKYGVEKLYRVVVAGNPSQEVITQLTEGIWLAEGKVRAKRVRVVGHQGEATILEMVLAEGKNREVRRMLAKFGHKVMSLTRVAVGPVTLKGLKFGQWRALTSYEVELLQKVAAGIPVSMPWMMADRPIAPRAPRRGEARTGIGGAGAAPHLGGPSAERDRRPMMSGPRPDGPGYPRPSRPSSEGTFPGRRPVGGGPARFQDGPPRSGGRPPMNDGPRPPRDGGPGPRYQDGPRPGGSGPRFQGGPPRDGGGRPPMNDGPRPPRDGGPGPRYQDGPRPGGSGPRFQGGPPRDGGGRPPMNDGPRPPRDGGPGPRPGGSGPRFQGGPPRDGGGRPPMNDGPRPPRDGGSGPRYQDGPRPGGFAPRFQGGPPRDGGGGRPPMNNGPRPPRSDNRPPMMSDRSSPPRPPGEGRPPMSDGPTTPRPGRTVRPMKGDAPSPGARIPLPDGLPPSQRQGGSGGPGRPARPGGGMSNTPRRPSRPFSTEPPGRKIIGLQSEGDNEGPRPNLKRRPKPITKPRRKGND